MNCHLRDIGIPSVAITSTDDPLLKPFDIIIVAISPGKNVHDSMKRC